MQHTIPDQVRDDRTGFVYAPQPPPTLSCLSAARARNPGPHAPPPQAALAPAVKPRGGNVRLSVDGCGAPSTPLNIIVIPASRRDRVAAYSPSLADYDPGSGPGSQNRFCLHAPASPNSFLPFRGSTAESRATRTAPTGCSGPRGQAAGRQCEVKLSVDGCGVPSTPSQHHCHPGLAPGSGGGILRLPSRT